MTHPQVPAALRPTRIAGAAIEIARDAVGQPVGEPGIGRDIGRREVQDALHGRDEALRRRLDGIVGLDLATGLRPVCGKLASYLHLLTLFAQGHADDLTALRRCLAAGDLPGLQGLAHGLKGSAATLGAEAVRQRAQALELAVRAGVSRADLEACIAELELALVPLLADLRPCVAAAPSTASAAERVQVLTLLTRLESLLAVDDSRAGDLWRSAGPLIASVLGPVATRLGSEIEGFAFDQALATLRAARAGTLGGAPAAQCGPA